MKKSQQQRSGGEGGSTLQSKWPWFEPMRFIKDIITSRKMRSNLIQQSISSEESDDSMVETFDSVSNTPASAIDGNDCGPSSSDTSEHNFSVPQPPSKTSKKRRNPNDSELINIEKEKLRLIEQQISIAETHDENYHFVMSLLPIMRKLPCDAQLRARIKMQQILLDEMNQSTSNNLRLFFNNFDDGSTLLANSQSPVEVTKYTQLS